jgi:small subunit ribosomal protein S12
MTTIHQAEKNKSKRIKKSHYTDVRSLFQAPHRRGHVVKLRIVSPKKPNSAKRKIARVKLSNKYMVSAKIKGQGHNLQAYSQVLVSGGRANDLPGVRYNMVKGKFSFN